MISQSREEILKKFHDLARRGVPIIGSGAGTGLSAKSAEHGGADLIIVYNSGMFRMEGQGSACGRVFFSDANQVVLDMAREVLPVVKHTPVVAGVFASDPHIDLGSFIRRLKELGYAGIQNFPTMGSTDASLGRYLEEMGFGYSREVEMVRIARSLDMLTTPYCFTPEEAAAMTQAGADVVVAHMGLTSTGLIGAKVYNTLDVCVEKISAIAAAAKSVNDDVLVIAHGGSIAAPEDVEFILHHTENVVGFYGASSSERLPVEKRLVRTVEDFKQLSVI
ncbi:MAG: phosphoenolpyruvate hydrolase family protein [Oscillospiraceae bacterium]